MGSGTKRDLVSDIAAQVRSAVRDRVVNGQRRWTVRDLVHDMAQGQTEHRSVVRAAIRDLIAEGVLEYRYTFGQSYLALSFRRPVALTSRFTIVSPRYSGALPSSTIPVVMAPGVSFGDGRHPTTRLALQALGRAWPYLQERHPCVAPHVVDIGTGSGILAIAAACLGAASVTALDIDACACSETRHNVRLNPKIAGIVQVIDSPVESIEQPFDLIMANLRLPTLVRLAGWVAQHLTSRGCLVVSGCREEEWGGLRAVYRERNLQPLWQSAQGGWAAGLFQLANHQDAIQDT